MRKKKPLYDYDHTTGEGQKRLMYESAGHVWKPKTIDLLASEDYGSDPLGNGMFRMVPSGDNVDLEERNRRLSR